MRMIIGLAFLALITACEKPETPAVEDTMFQHAIEYTDKAEQAETTVMEGADARRRAIEEQEQ